jgi:hypothetical protein
VDYCLVGERFPPGVTNSRSSPTTHGQSIRLAAPYGANPASGSRLLRAIPSFLAIAGTWAKGPLKK